MIFAHGRNFASRAELRRFEEVRDENRRRAREERAKERWTQLVDEDAIREPDSSDLPDSPEW